MDTYFLYHSQILFSLAIYRDLKTFLNEVSAFGQKCIELSCFFRLATKSYMQYSLCIRQKQNFHSNMSIL